jgi:surface polysaccharide O-acyltransferase-like enzyme
MEEKKRYDGLDIIKFIAILMVIATHIPLYEYDFIKDNNISIYVQFLFKMVTQGVPLFFAVNGFLMFKKDFFDLKQHVIKMMKIFILSVFWSLVLIVINLQYDKTPINRSIIVDLFLKTSTGSLYTGEIWFLQAMFSIYMVFPLLWFVFKNDKKIYKYLMYILSGSLFINEVLRFSTLVLENEIRIKQFNDTISFINRYNTLEKYGWFLLYFIVGGYLLYEKEKISKKVSIIGFFCIMGIPLCI